LQICASVNPANPAPVTVNEALSPGANPSFGEPPAKVPAGPVVNPKSSTTLLKPAGTLPKSASEKLKVDDRLGACCPVNPFSPEELALPRGGKSYPMPVIVDVDPGDVMFEVFVTVKVKVLVCELNVQTIVAVEVWPELTPTMLMVSARAVAAKLVKTNNAPTDKTSLPNRDMSFLLVLNQRTPRPTAVSGKVREKLVGGNCKAHFGVLYAVLILEACLWTVNQ
jgi:hypothetical protein